jgi:hypothetical protein
MKRFLKPGFILLLDKIQEWVDIRFLYGNFTITVDNTHIKAIWTLYLNDVYDSYVNLSVYNAFYNFDNEETFEGYGSIVNLIACNGLLEKLNNSLKYEDFSNRKYMHIKTVGDMVKNNIFNDILHLRDEFLEYYGIQDAPNGDFKPVFVE